MSALIRTASVPERLYCRVLVLRTSSKDPDSEIPVISYTKSPSWLQNPVSLYLKTKEPRPLKK